MEARDFRNLTEAYYQVYENQELDEVTQRKSFKFQHRADELDALRHSRNKALKAGNTGEVKSIERWINEPNVSSLAQKERVRRLEKRPPSRLRSGSIPTQKESYDIYDLILSHLLDEGYAETPEAAEVMMVNMSEDWIDSILDEEYLYEMRKEDKVAGKKKTPLMVPGKRGTIQKTESGGWKKQTPMVGNPKVSMGRQRQGGGGWRELYGYQRHPHGGAHDGMGKGSERGKRLPKGLKPGINTRNVGGKKQVVVGPKAPKTPVERFKAQKQENEYVKNASYGSKTFRDYNTRQPSPTRLDVLRARRAARLAKKS